MSLALLPVTRQLLIRALLWALIGAIYAPLFVILEALFAPMLGVFALAAAAACAGAIGAAYYSARQAALAASLIGVLATLFVLIVFSDHAAFWHAALLCGVLGLSTGLLIDFPSRCTANVPAKALVGAVTGAASGAALSALASFGLGLSSVVAVAFLVSVNGVIYVASVRWVVSATGGLPRRWCPFAEGAIIGLVAVIVGGSIWAFASALSGYDRPGLFLQVVESTSSGLPFAVAAGLAAGSVTGILLELFDFAWVDDL
ncbi:hypothetical protein [Halochromatium salexigens]|uniref:Uncharacterized protein n=1 Tax=Halochromatium salexigens TaxID=49447 RepID=A0AAJ0UJ50_HALSE|nr:hypothetical protein [Halochromatium salexigens]MBK5931700.1 hypothetical protein [Halochromatium salexigens]